MRGAHSVWFEVALQISLQGNGLYTMTVRGLLVGGSVMMRQMRAFAVRIELVFGGVSVMAAAVFTTSSVVALPATPV